VVAMMKRLHSLLVLLPLTILACGQGGGNDERVISRASSVPVAHTPRLNGAAPDLQTLASRAIVALEVGDTAALMRLLVTKEEFMRHLYPEYALHYPVARDTSTLTREFLWENQTLSSLGALNRAIRDLSGRKMDLLGLSFREGVRRFTSYSLHEGTLLRVRFDDGRVADLHALGSIVEMDGGVKLLTYRDRERGEK